MLGFGLTDVFAVYLLTASSEYSVAPPIDYSMGFVLAASSVSGPTNANVLAVFAMVGDGGCGMLKSGACYSLSSV